MNKTTLWIVGVIAVLLVAWFVWPGGNDSQAPGESETPTTSPSEYGSPTPSASTSHSTSPSRSPSPSLSPDAQGNITLKGELKASDNSVRGNLMLETDHTKIYLRTSRDFSALIGKKVEVTIKGTLDSFVLVDIKEK